MVEAIVGHDVRGALDAAKGIVVAVERRRGRLVIHLHGVDCGRVLVLGCGGRSGL